MGTRFDSVRNAKIGEIVHVNTGLTVERDTLLKFMKSARVVYVGETHDNVASHDVQLEVIRMLKESGVDFAVGVEMLKRPFQPVLDEWVAGKLTEKDFIEKSEWFREWSMDFRLYGDILNYLRENKIPLVGLNVTEKLRKQFRNREKEPLTEKLKKEIPEIDYGDKLHKRFILDIFSNHKHKFSDSDLERFYSVQCLWEEYMAESISLYLSSEKGKGKKMVVLCGGGHILFDFGIPSRVLRRTGEPYLNVYTLMKKEEAMDPDTSPLIQEGVRLLPANFVWIIDKKTLPAKPKMGILMKEEKGKGVVISGVVKGSPAEKSGLKKGDILLQLDEEKISGTFDASYLVGKKKKGDVVHVQVKRSGKLLRFDVKLELHVFKNHAKTKSKKHDK